MTSKANAEPISWQQFLTEARIGVVASVGKDGLPHAVPVDLLFHEGSVYIWCLRTSRKARNTVEQGYAAVVAYRGNSGVLIRGPATAIGQEQISYGSITAEFRMKFSDRSDSRDYGNDCVLRVHPSDIVPFGPRLLTLRD